MNCFKQRMNSANRLVQTCTCGKHSGIGDASPHERAQMYNWSRERKRPEYNDEQRKYLESYESSHGKLGEHEFLFNSSRFKDDPIVIACLNGAKLPKNW